MIKTKILIISILMIILLISGCVENRPIVGKIGDKSIGNIQVKNLPYIIEKIENNSYRVIPAKYEIDGRYQDIMTQGYMDLDNRCDIRFVIGIVGDDSRVYAGSSTIELIIKTNNCSYNP